MTPVDVKVVEVLSPEPNEFGDVPCPNDGELVNVQCWSRPTDDPMTATGSLPILQGAVAAIEERKHVTIARTTAEQRRHDMDAELQEIAAWWAQLTESDILATMPKAIEYGASDLDMMGQGVLMLQGDIWDGGDPGEKRAVGQELAILFYLLGKISRALSAAQHGQRCSDDTIKDIRIYAVILQRIRETGSWVGR